MAKMIRQGRKANVRLCTPVGASRALTLARLVLRVEALEAVVRALCLQISGSQAASAPLESIPQALERIQAENQAAAVEAWSRMQKAMREVFQQQAKQQ